MRKTRGVLIGAMLLAAAGCTGDTEARARQAVEKMKEAIPDVEAKALEQKATPEAVKEAQEALIAANEYMGEANGKLDSVTVNAIEAFQTAHNITADGMLNDRTQRELRAVLAGAKKAGS